LQLKFKFKSYIDEKKKNFTYHVRDIKLFFPQNPTSLPSGRFWNFNV